MTYQALLFDLDNTLIDFTRSEELSLNSVYEDFFYHLEFSHFRSCYQSINKELWKQVETGQLNTAQVKHDRFRLLIETLALTHDYKVVAGQYEKGLADHADWFPGVKETLLQLKKSFQLGIVTNGLGYVQQAKFVTLGISELCECYVVSEIVGVAKPNKAIFDMALKQLNYPAENVLMVGDSVASDYFGAMNAGIDFCWVNLNNETLPHNISSPKYEISSVNQLPEKLGFLV